MWDGCRRTHTTLVFQIWDHQGLEEINDSDRSSGEETVITGRTVLRLGTVCSFLKIFCIYYIIGKCFPTSNSKCSHLVPHFINAALWCSIHAMPSFMLTEVGEKTLSRKWTFLVFSNLDSRKHQWCMENEGRRIVPDSNLCGRRFSTSFLNIQMGRHSKFSFLGWGIFLNGHSPSLHISFCLMCAHQRFPRICTTRISSLRLKKWEFPFNYTKMSTRLHEWSGFQIAKIEKTWVSEVLQINLFPW